MDDASQLQQPYRQTRCCGFLSVSVMINQLCLSDLDSKLERGKEHTGHGGQNLPCGLITTPC